MTGCITHPQNPAATQPSTIINLATTQPSYWLDQPAVATVRSDNFDKLWKACEDVARNYLFTLDRQDYRSGVLTTVPMVSAQWFEPWRPDERTFYDLVEGSIATIRRSIRFEFTHMPDDTWQLAPKVLVERQAVAEQQITSVVLYHSIFSGPSRDPRASLPGSRETDQGIVLPGRYWYPVRRDSEFEKVISIDVQKRLQRKDNP